MKESDSKNGRECTLYIDGMHCASCEVLIEKKLSRRKEVEGVVASLADHKVQIQLGEGKLDIESVNREFADLGYTFSTKRFSRPQDPPLLTLTGDGRMTINPKRMRQVLTVVGMFLLVLAVFFLFDRSGLGSSVNVSASSSFTAFVLFGLVAGTSSCAALVGGVLLSLAKQWNEVYIAEESVAKRSQPHMMFHIGRLISFAVLGGVLGAVGGALAFSVESTALVTIAVSVMMLLLALQMLGIESLRGMRFTMPKFIGRFAADETNFQGRYMPLMAGVLTFFLPCGFTVVAQGLALSSGSFATGAMIMSAFALGTLPMLGLISASSIRFNRKPRFTASFNKVAGLLVLFFAFYNFNSQLNVLGLPSLTDIKFGSGEVIASGAEQSGDIQVIRMSASSSGYSPTAFTVRAGKKVRWEINDSGASGCASILVARGLLDKSLVLQRGLNVAEFTPAKPGIYKFSCTMGMYNGTITVV